MNVNRRVRKILLKVFYIQIAFLIITIFLTVKAIDECSYSDTIITYVVGDWREFNPITLQLKENDDFHYMRSYGCVIHLDVYGKWSRSNDTLELNSPKISMYSLDKTGKNKEVIECLYFKNAKYKIRNDSLIYISGISDFNNLKLFKFR